MSHLLFMIHKNNKKRDDNSSDGTSEAMYRKKINKQVQCIDDFWMLERGFGSH